MITNIENKLEQLYTSPYNRSCFIILTHTRQA